jgi:hypothetical protein
MANLETDKHFLVGIFSDESEILHQVEEIRHKGVKITEVFTPYPIHGMEHALGYKRSWMPRAAFMFGALGTTCAITMQSLMMGFDWPMIFGGKPAISIPDFVPVTFEMTVLFAAFGMVGTFLISQNLKPHGVPKMFDRRATDDKFVMAIDLAKNSLTEEQIRLILSEMHAEEIYRRDFSDEELEGSFFRYLADLFANGVTSSSRKLK